MTVNNHPNHRLGSGNPPRHEYEVLVRSYVNLVLLDVQTPSEAFENPLIKDYQVFCSRCGQIGTCPTIEGTKVVTDYHTNAVNLGIRGN